MKKKVILIVVGILLVTSILIGISYAYYIFSVSQSGSNIVRSDCFEITYTDGNAINLTNTISLTDKEARNLDPYTFTIKNICNQVVDYSVNIETLNTSTMDLDAIATKLDNKKKQILGQLDDNVNIVNNNASSSKTIYSNILKAGEEKTFNLRIWIDESATVEQSANKSYSSKVVINSKLIPNYSEADLISGNDFNSSIKGLADSPQSITKIQRSLTAPQESNNAIDIASSSSAKPVYAWFDDGTVYIYSEANKIYMNEDSKNMFRAFSGISSLDLSFLDTSKVTNMSGMFSYISSIPEIDLSEFDTSNVTDMSYMFNYLYIYELDLSHFNTSKVTNMENMFSGMSPLVELNLSGFDTSNVTNMRQMFYNSPNIKHLDLSSFDTSKVTDMSRMFYALYNVESLDISSFYTPNVTNMSNMFHLLNKVTYLDVSHFDTSNVTDMSYMFDLLFSITSLDLSSFDTSKAENVTGMFHGNTNLKTIYVDDNWNTSNIVNSGAMFGDCNSLVGGAGTVYDSSHSDIEYARIDDSDNGQPGYFTLKTN